MALESVQALGEALDAAGGDLDAAPALYTQRRLPDVHAFQDLERMQVLNVSGRRGGPLPWAAAKAVMSLSVLAMLVVHKLLPALSPQPVWLFAALGDSRMPYRAIRRAVFAQAAAAGALLLGGLLLASRAVLAAVASGAATLPVMA